MTEIIDFELLTKILKPSESNVSIENRGESYEKYIEKIEEFIEDKNLGKYINIDKAKTESKIIPEVMYEHSAQHIITIQNLKIRAKLETINLHALDSESSINNFPKGYSTSFSGAVRIKFINNEFIAGPSLKGHAQVKIFLGRDIYIDFTKNKFKWVNLYFNFANTENAFVILKNNIFDNKVVFKGGKTAGKVMELLEEDIVDKNTIRAREQELTSDIQFTYNMTRISNNKFKQLRVGGMINFFFIKKNTFEKIVMQNLPHHIHWNYYQILDKKGNHAHYHKKLFIELKKETIKKNDKFQELLFTREIEICERKIIKKEIAWWKPTQDKVVLFIGRFFSNHGTSWINPLIILFIVNILFSSFVYWFVSPELNRWETLDIFAKFFNPISSLDASLEEYVTNKDIIKYPFILSITNIAQKLFLAGTIYETIKVFRRFIAK